MAAILTAIIFLSTKLFDHYHNKGINDLKIYLDVEKGLRENGHNEEDIVFAKLETQNKIREFKARQESKSLRKEKYPRVSKIYQLIVELGLCSVLAGVVCILFTLTIELSNGNIEIDAWGVGGTFIFIGFALCVFLEIADFRLKKKHKFEWSTPNTDTTDNQSVTTEGQ